DGYRGRRHGCNHRRASTPRPTMGVARHDAELTEEVPGTQHRDALATSLHVGLTALDRIEVERELSLVHHDVSRVPLLWLRNIRHTPAVEVRKGAKERNRFEVSGLHVKAKSLTQAWPGRVGTGALPKNVDQA